jgi:O-antigen/teichoic acid export membrane protein
LLKKKAKRFVLLNSIFSPITMVLGLLSSFFVIRRLGVEQYSIILVLNGVRGTLSFLLGLGFSATLLKLWVGYDKEKRQGLLIFTILLQLVMFLIIFLINLFIPGFFKCFGTVFFDNIPNGGFFIILITVIISTIFSSILNAELDNRISIASNMFCGILVPTWLFFVTIYTFSSKIITGGLLIIYLIGSLILFFGSFKYIRRLVLTNLLKILDRKFFIEYFSFLFTISMARVLRYFNDLSFFSILLSRFGMLAELVYLGILMKIIGIVTNIINIPINKVVGVLFINAKKSNNLILLSKIYQFVTRYFIFSYFCIFAFLFYFSESFISLVYGINPKLELFNFFYLYFLFSALLGVSNWITQFYSESYKFVTLTSIISSALLVSISYAFVAKIGLLAVLLSLFINSAIFNGGAFIFSHIKYREINFPKKMFFVFSLVFVVAISSGYLISNYLLASFVSLFIFVICILLFYRFDQYDRDIIKEIVPAKILKVFNGVLNEKNT